MQLALRLLLAALAPLSAAAQGTLVKDINPSLGAASYPSYPQRFKALREKVIFAAIRQDVGQEIWASDGTEAGTILLKDINPSGDSQPWNPTLFRDRILFLARDTDHWQLWSTNGTELGTVRLADVGPVISTSTGLMAAAEDHVIFFVQKPAGNEIWRSDGTAEGTEVVTAMGYLDLLAESGAYGNDVYFSQKGLFAGSGELWKTDGTAAGTVLVKELWPGMGSDPLDFTVAGGLLYFTAETAEGRELWRTDGTPGGTILLKDIYAGSTGSEPKDLVALDNGLLLFSARSASLSSGLWKSDGTPAGTVQLFAPPFLSSNANSLVSFGDEAWFLVPWFFEDDELWRTDGTEAGTYEIAKHVALTGGFTAVGSGKLVVWTGFLPGFSGTASEPFVSDGTTAGTLLAADVWLGQTGSLAGGYTRAGDKVYFYADDGVHSTELHALDASAFGGWVAEPFGQGCGLSGAPELTLAGELTSGSAVSIELAHAASFAPAVFYLSASSAQDVIGDCNNYLAQPLFLAAAATDGAGATSLPVTVPSDPALVGVFVALQSATVVLGGPFLGLAEFSNGLELVIGS